VTHVTRQANATVLAFDFGTRRIGVAVGNTLTRSARALATIEASRTKDALSAIAALIDEWQPDRLIVGLPVHADGTPHAMTTAAKAFADSLRTRFGLAVDFADERFTSEIAASALRDEGRGGRGERSLRDQVAAQVILQAWLDEPHDERPA
jgi:putative Holliday junction resolvase